jgi:anti-anti-sigma factor
MGFRVAGKNQDCAVIPFPEGKPQEASRKRFTDTLLELARDGAYRVIVVDLDRTTWFSSVDLGVLAFALKECQRRRVDLRIAGANQRVRGIFDITKMSSIFTFYENVEAAVAAPGASGGSAPTGEEGSSPGEPAP